jgi:hypothetical protein
MKKVFEIMMSVALLVTLGACTLGPSLNLSRANSEIQLTTPGPNPEVNKPAENGRVAALGTGLWHGVIALFTLIISFFNPEVQMYEVHNNGNMYNVGYLLGVAVLFLLLGFTGGRRF